MNSAITDLLREKQARLRSILLETSRKVDSRNTGKGSVELDDSVLELSKVKQEIESIQRILDGGVSFTKIDLYGRTYKVKMGAGEKEFTIVPAVIADPLLGFISDSSPIAIELSKASVGDVVPVGTPSGLVTCEVLEIK